MAISIGPDEAEKTALTTLTRKHGVPQSPAVRARIVLAAANGLRNKEIAAKLDVCSHTVGVWRRGLPANVWTACTTGRVPARPKGATHWSLRTMAKAVGHAPSTIHRIWQAFGLQPHRAETFKLSSDPLFVEKVRDIVGL